MRSTRTANGKVVLFSDNRQLSGWTHDVYWTAIHAMGRKAHVTGPVECVLDFIVPTPHKREGELWPTQKGTGDIDKLTRAILDGLTGTVWRDDAQVVRMLASKRYSNTSRHPGVAIAVYQIPVG